MVEARRDKSRAGAVIRWVEEYCRVPSGVRKGDCVYLSAEQRQQIVAIYNAPDAPRSVPVDGELGAYLALLHVCGIEAPGNGPMPDVQVDLFTTLNACGPNFAEGGEAPGRDHHLPRTQHPVSEARGVSDATSA